MKKFFRENWIYVSGGVFVLAIFALRLFHLTILPVFADEAIYIRWAQVMKAEETLRFLPLSDGKEPLFMWVIIPFLKFIHDPLVAGRIVSVLSGLGTLIGVSFLSYLLFKNKKVVIAAGLIYAISPFSFFFDRMALVDSMLSMFGVWTFIFAYLSFTKERLDCAMLAGFALGGAWLTKSPALFFAIMLPTLWLFIKSPKSLLKVIPLTLVTFAIGYGFYNILRLGPNFSLIASRNLDYVYPISHILKSPFDPLKPFLLQSLQWLMTMGPWELLVLGIIGLLVSWKGNWKQVLVLFIWFMGPIVIQSEYAKVFTARYIFFSVPFLIILAACMFTNLTVRWLQIVVYGLLAVFIIQSGIFDYYLLVNPAKANLSRSERSGYLEEWTAGQGIKKSADYLRNYQLQNPDKKIVVGTEGYFGTLPDGLQIYLNDAPQITIIGVGINISSLPQSLIDANKSGDETYLLINKSRLNIDPSKIGLVLISSYPKAVRPDGSKDSLLLLKVKAF
ncbi:MAG TPA: glycosyltransferase family 39 protein [Candidatus Saccharimonadales bacterium]|nr:glycosyltransferase family 39 protein [Candidatus Saccharimonadales bacterium]